MKNLKHLLLLVCVLIPLQAFASATLFTAGKFHADNPDGSPMAGGELYSYIAGTTSPQNTYTDESGNTANTDPIILDNNGNADVWLNGNYKFNLLDSNGIQQQGWPVDNISDTLFTNAFSGTSTTSSAVTTGSITFTTQSGKAWGVGQFLALTSNANSANFMFGTVTSYTGTTLVMNITESGGSGTYNDWNIGLSGAPGPQGAAGPVGAGLGDVNGPASVTSGYIVLFDGTTGKLIKEGTGGPGTAAYLNVGTSANQVVQLTSASKYPAADGSLITNLTAANLVGALPAIDGSHLTGLPGNAVVTNSTNGKIVFGAVTMQWGRGSEGGPSSCASTDFPTAFSGVPYSVTATPTFFGSGTVQGSVIIQSVTASKFCSIGDDPGPISWIAIGPT